MLADLDLLLTADDLLAGRRGSVGFPGLEQAANGRASNTTETLATLPSRTRYHSHGRGLEVVDHAYVVAVHEHLLLLGASDDCAELPQRRDVAVGVAEAVDRPSKETSSWSRPRARSKSWLVHASKKSSATRFGSAMRHLLVGCCVTL
jgi:hypothetical protein